MRHGLIAAVLGGLALLPLGAAAQVTGTFDWSELGVASLGGMPSTASQTTAGTTVTMTWAAPNDGGFAVANPGYGDYVMYYAGTFGTVTEGAIFNFDQVAFDLDDRIEMTFAFSSGVDDLTFNLTDVDQDTFDDFVEVYIDRGAGWENARSLGFDTLGGSAVRRDNEKFGDGWEGDAPTSGADGDIAFDFGTETIFGLRIVYFGGDDVGGDPTAQLMGLSDLTFTAYPPVGDLSLAQTVSDAYPRVGDQITYTVTVQNAGPDASDVVVRDLLPSGVSFVSSSAGGGYDAGTGLWSVGSLGAGGSATLTIAATVLAGGERENLAEVWTASAVDTDSTPGNAASDPFEDDTATTEIVPGGSSGGGTAPVLSCQADAVRSFDWDANAWPAGSLAQSYAASGVTLGMTVTGSTGDLQADATGQTPLTNASITGGITPTEQGLFLLADYGDRSDEVTVDMDLGADGLGVSKLQFAVFDVDYFGGQFQDRLSVAGYLGGAFVAPILTGSSANSVSGTTALGAASNDNTLAGGNVTVTFTSPVDRVTVTYGSGSLAPTTPGQQAITISDLAFCDPQGAVLAAHKTVAPVAADSFALSGEDVYYTISVTNTGAGPADLDSLFLVDALPPETAFFTGDADEGGSGTGPVVFAAGASGLTLGSADYGYATGTAAPASLAGCTYTPTGAYDPQVRFLCLAPKGRMAAGDPDPGFDVTFRARIE